MFLNIDDVKLMVKTKGWLLERFNTSSKEDSAYDQEIAIESAEEYASIVEELGQSNEDRSNLIEMKTYLSGILSKAVDSSIATKCITTDGKLSQINAIKASRAIRKISNLIPSG